MSGLPSRLVQPAKKKHRLKIGHGGTLDPLASGVLLVGFGDACKLSHDFQECYKTYVATAVFGVGTDSYDMDGKIISKGNPQSISDTHLRNALQKFTGVIMQRPPLHSAIQVNGVRLYDYARSGQTFSEPIMERTTRIRRIDLDLFDTAPDLTTLSPVLKAVDQMVQYRKQREGETPDESVSLLEAAVRDSDLPSPIICGISQSVENIVPHLQGLPAFRITVEAAGGTYIRSLVRDIGEYLGCPATLIDLVRTRQGDYALDETTPNLLQCRDPRVIDRQLVPFKKESISGQLAEF
ncbi:pseudouridine synthase [Dimargaris cristalligena]|uniref:tRNA pseudouridine(55) synthase n=1 Tax=Dimargaris cristalligena TaxID=215637 RepID=A0A4Q0A0D5_9FUNG|nr:pseudouridine synthase [Dimargaris cristalligena]|eukprot:RKP39495.1 pseudouridine synthase [Dimargaris cristalligena]